MRFMALDSVTGFQPRHHGKAKKHGITGDLNASSCQLLIIPLPVSWIRKLVAGIFFSALFIISFPWLESMFIHKIYPAIIHGGGVDSGSGSGSALEYSINMDALPSVLRDLANDGLLKMGNKTLLLGGNHESDAIYSAYQILNANKMETMILSSDSDLLQHYSIADEDFDFAFAKDLHSDDGGDRAHELIDRTLKVGGVFALQLSGNPLAVAAAASIQKPSNYRIVYLRKFEHSTFVAMRKTHPKQESPAGKRTLLGKAKKLAALSNLEDVLLEPPRAPSAKSNKVFLRRRTKYLPDLMGDSLENYPRRIFIDVDLSEQIRGNSDADVPGWFEKHYPTRNKDFEIYKVEAVAAEGGPTPAISSSGRDRVEPQIGMSDWLRRNVKEEEYVVMKAEAEVVEEMVKNGVLGLVDELFLECKHQGLNNNNNGNKAGRQMRTMSRRAYWECLALYGRLKDEGVAVHQWWG